MKKIILFALIAVAQLTTGCESIVNFMDSLNAVETPTYSGSYTTASSANVPMDGIKAIELNWAFGEVDVEPADQKTIEISETCKWDLKDSEKLHYLVDGSTLRIQFADSGYAYNKNHGKELKVTLPDSISLDTIKIQAISADVSVNDIKIENTDVSSDSGDLDIDVRGKGTSVKLVTESGSIDLSVKEVKSCDLKSSLGDITFEAKKGPDTCNFESEQGSISLTLPEDDDFEATVDLSTGDFQCDFDVSGNGPVYKVGSGLHKYKLVSDTGDADISKNE